MYYITNNEPLSKEEKEIIEAEIELYKSTTGDYSSILEVKLSKAKVIAILEEW